MSMQIDREKLFSAFQFNNTYNIRYKMRKYLIAVVRPHQHFEYWRTEIFLV